MTTLRERLAKQTALAATELAVPQPDGAVRCLACGHRCFIHPGLAGVCQVRFNEGGQLRVPSGYVAGVQIDPMEKKPFFHAYPGANALSFGMLGCDLHCSYCQNWITSQALRDEAAVSGLQSATAESLVELGIRQRTPVLVSTYNEPLITAEWAVDVFRRAHARGLVCGFVSNGNGTPEVLDFLRPHVDLYKVDLKGFRDRPYRQLGGLLSNVLDTIKDLVERRFWVEIVTLVIPGFNDSDAELKDAAAFLAAVSPDLPWHVTAFHPDYRMDSTPPTPTATLVRAHDIGREAGLRYVYVGNVPGQAAAMENTYCPGCQFMLISRRGFSVLSNALVEGRCPQCSTRIPGFWGPNCVNPLERPKGPATSGPNLRPRDKRKGAA